MEASTAVDIEISEVRRVAHQWAAAVAAGDLDRLRELMTDDIVVIHGNGRALCGLDAVAEDISAALATWRVEQHVEFDETVVTGTWAFDRARVHTALVRRNGDTTRVFDSRTLTLLRKDEGKGWRVARVIGVVRQQSD